MGLSCDYPSHATVYRRGSNVMTFKDSNNLIKRGFASDFHVIEFNFLLQWNFFGPFN